MDTAGPGLGPYQGPVAVAACFHRILEEVVQNLPHPVGVGMGRGERRAEAGLEAYRRRSAAVQLDDIENQRVQIDRHRAHGRSAGIVGECVHHFLHRLHLLDDGASEAIHLRRIDGLDLVEVLVPEALRGELDRGKGVLDLVREPTRHLAPRCASLRFDEFGDIVEHDDVTLPAGERCGAAHEHAPAAGRGDPNLLASLAQAVGRGLLEPLEEGMHQGVELGMTIREGVERRSDHCVEIDAENLRGGPVGGDQAALRVQRQHSRGQPPEHRFEVGTLRLDEKLALAGLVVCAFQLARHLVEGRDQESDLVLRRARELGFVVPGRDRLGAFGEILQRGDHATRRAKRRVHRGEQADEQHDGQREGEAELQRLAKIRQLPVLRRRGFDAVGESIHPLGDGKECLEQLRVAGRLARGHRHHDLNVQSAVSDVVETDVVARPPGLGHDGLAGAARDHRGRIGVARADDVPVRADEGELRCAAQTPGVVERPDRLFGGERLEIRCDSRGLGEELAHSHPERGAAEIQRVVERRLDAHVEPAIDSPVQELEREVVDDGDRRDRQDHEDHDHPDRELGARTLRPRLVEQVVQVPGDEDAETDQCRGVDCEQDRVELAEPGGVLGGVAHEVRRSEQDQTQRDDWRGTLPDAVHRGIRHSNHPLSSRQSGLR